MSPVKYLRYFALLFCVKNSSDCKASTLIRRHRNETGMAISFKARLISLTKLFTVVFKLRDMIENGEISVQQLKSNHLKF